MRRHRISPCLLTALVWLAGGAARAQPTPNAPGPAIAFDTRHSDPNRQTVPWGDPYSGSLIDTHAHLNAPSSRRGATKADVLAAIAAARVARIVLAPAPNEGTFRNPEPTQAERLALVRTSGGRVLRMCGSEYLTDWMSDSVRRAASPGAGALEEKLARLRSDLKTGTCAGVGEIGFLHFDTAGGQPVVRLPAAYPPFVAIAQVAAAAGLPMDIHAEPFEPDGTTSHHAEIYGTIAVLFRDAPALRLIYSHNGLTNPRNARPARGIFRFDDESEVCPARALEASRPDRQRAGPSLRGLGRAARGDAGSLPHWQRFSLRLESAPNRGLHEAHERHPSCPGRSTARRRPQDRLGERGTRFWLPAGSAFHRPFTTMTRLGWDQR